MSLSIHEMWLQNFQVFKLQKLSYSLSGLKLETNSFIDNYKDFDNVAEVKIILKMHPHDYNSIFEWQSIQKDPEIKIVHL